MRVITDDIQSLNRPWVFGFERELDLESEDLVLEFAHGSRLLVTEGLGGLLQTADHGGRTAQENLDVVGGLGEPFLWWRMLGECFTRSGKDRKTYGNHISGDIADTTLPIRGGLVEDVVDAETLVLSGQSIEILLQQDILGGDVCEDEVNLGDVAGLAAADDGADNLEHWGDTGTAGDHTKVADHVGSVDEGALGAADLDGLADAETRQVLGDVSGRVGLDQEVEVAGLVVAADRGVGADDLLGCAVRLGEVGTDGDVLADGEAEDGRGMWEGEPVASKRGKRRC